MAAASGQLPSRLTWRSISMTNVVSPSPPSSAGVTKKPIERMKTSSDPARMPGMLSGRNTKKNAMGRFAPRLQAPDSRLVSMRRITAKSGSTMNGSMMWTMPT